MNLRALWLRVARQALIRARARPRRPKLAVAGLEERLVPCLWLLSSCVHRHIVGPPEPPEPPEPLPTGVVLGVGDLNADGFQDLVAGTQTKAGLVRAFSGADGRVLWSARPFGKAFTAGLSLGVGDLDADGFAEIVAGSGAESSPEVKVLDGRTGRVKNTFTPFSGATPGGLRLAIGDLDGDYTAEIVVATGPSSEVQVLNSLTGVVTRNIRAFSGGAAGVHVAVGDLDGDKTPEVVVGSGSSAALQAFNAATGAEVLSVSLDPAVFLGGVRVAAADTDADGRAEIIAGGGPGVVPTYQILDGRTGVMLRSITPFAGAVTEGVSVAARDVSGDGRAEVFVGSGPGHKPPLVRIVQGSGTDKDRSFNPFSGSPGVFSTRFGPMAPTLALASASDTPPVGDRATTLATVTLTGATSPGAMVFLGGRQTQADAAGQVAFSDVPLAPGRNSFTVVARDENGNVRTTTTIFNRLPTHPLDPIFDLSPASDTEPLGDKRTLHAVVTLVGQTTPGASVSLAGRTVTAKDDGSFEFPDVPLKVGSNAFKVQSRVGSLVSSHTATFFREAAESVAITLGLAADSDTPPVGDLTTTFATVTLVGQTTPGASVTFQGREADADGTGAFAFENVPLALGSNRLTASVATTDGRSGTASVTVTRQAPPPGTTVIREGDQFLKTVTVPVELGAPAQGRRIIRFPVLSAFDRTGEGGVGDNFLVSLVDPENPSETLLDRGTKGTSLFALNAAGFELAPGVDAAFGEVDSTIDSQVAEGEAAVNYFASLPEVDPSRIGLLGFSLGGGVAAVVADRPPARFGALALWAAVGDFQADQEVSLGAACFERDCRDGATDVDLGSSGGRGGEAKPRGRRTEPAGVCWPLASRRARHPGGDIGRYRTGDSGPVRSQEPSGTSAVHPGQLSISRKRGCKGRPLG